MVVPLPLRSAYGAGANKGAVVIEFKSTFQRTSPRQGAAIVKAAVHLATKGVDLVAKTGTHQEMLFPIVISNSCHVDCSLLIIPGRGALLSTPDQIGSF